MSKIKRECKKKEEIIRKNLKEYALSMRVRLSLNTSFSVANYRIISVYSVVGHRKRCTGYVP